MARCRSCGAAIEWVLTDSGKSMPVDTQPRADGTLVLSTENDVLRARSPGLFDAGKPRYVSHFATCPQAAQHRRK